MTISKERFIQRSHAGTVLYHLYYSPKRTVQRIWQRGPIRKLGDVWAQHQMEKAVYKLPALSRVDSNTFFDIHFLTGDRFWYQTVFCAYSMAQHSELSLRPVIYDDGSLLPKNEREIRRIFPAARIYSKAELDERIESYLPEGKFPYIRERRKNYPNIRKLTDIHAGSEGWKLVLDSDMLFFKRPDTLLNWLKSPQQPCHMIDVATSYGYSKPLMESLADSALAERLNVGICGLNSSFLDWEKIEYWCRVLIEHEGTHYYQEQALIAMLMAGQNCHVVDGYDYQVMPSRKEVMSPQAILHHYVADSKPWYFRYGWRHMSDVV